MLVKGDDKDARQNDLSMCMDATDHSVSYAKEWRGIVPLHSTCENVKRILSVSTCKRPYDLEDGRVYITFSKKPCADGWNVPPGTVLSITFYPKTKPFLTEFGVDLGKYQKEETAYPSNYVFYSNKEEGVMITVTPDQKLDSINEELTVEIFGTVKGGAAPIALPTVCSSDVQIVDHAKR